MKSRRTEYKSEKLAIEGGQPVRRTTLSYGRQTIDENDIRSVCDVLNSDWLTTGPKVPEFENAICTMTGAKHAVAVSSGTAALHSAMFAIGIRPGDEVIVPSITFAATANAVVYQGGKPVFCDVDPNTLLINLDCAKNLINSRTKAIVSVDYAGQPCDYGLLIALCRKHDLTLISDACHSLGAKYKNQSVATLADLTVFSFHPLKHITTAEGGMVCTNNSFFAERMKSFRNHGIKTDHRQREASGSWYYEMSSLGYNYRLSDLQCALGISQLSRLNTWIERRNYLAQKYDAFFEVHHEFLPLKRNPNILHAYHLYVVRINSQLLRGDQNTIFTALRAEGIGVNVHYIPVHLHPYYRQTFDTQIGQCVQAEKVYKEILTLPLFPSMTERDLVDVFSSLEKVITRYHITNG